MATTGGRNNCAICGKERRTVLCDGCSQTFCYNHLNDHRQELSKHLDEIEVIRDVFRQTLSEQTAEPRKHPLLKEIDEWERDSIRKVQKAAEEARQQLFQHITGHITEMEGRLNKLTDQVRASRQDNDFVETDLNEWKYELQKLEEELHKPSRIALQRDTGPLVTKIYVTVSSPIGSNTHIEKGSLSMLNIDINARWLQNGITVAGGNESGAELNQLCKPEGVYVYDDDQTLYVADYGNHRIVEWKYGATSGQVVAGECGSGNRADQLSGPTDVIVDRMSDCLIICDQNNKRVVRWPRQKGASGRIIIPNIDCRGLVMDSDGFLYISDWKKHEVRRWREGDTVGTVVAGGNGKGNRLDQLSCPSYLCIDQDNALYVSDRDNDRVVKWTKDAKEGIVVAGGKGRGTDLTELLQPFGIAVDQRGTVYVVDSDNHRVMRWPKGASQGSIIAGGHGQGEQANQFNGSVGLSFDRKGNLYVADYDNNRIQKFNILSG